VRICSRPGAHTRHPRRCRVACVVRGRVCAACAWRLGWLCGAGCMIRCIGWKPRYGCGSWASAGHPQGPFCSTVGGVVRGRGEGKAGGDGGSAKRAVTPVGRTRGRPAPTPRHTRRPKGRHNTSPLSSISYHRLWRRLTCVRSPGSQLLNTESPPFAFSSQRPPETTTMGKSPLRGCLAGGYLRACLIGILNGALGAQFARRRCPDRGCGAGSGRADRTRGRGRTLVWRRRGDGARRLTGSHFAPSDGWGTKRRVRCCVQPNGCGCVKPHRNSLAARTPCPPSPRHRSGILAGAAGGVHARQCERARRPGWEAAAWRHALGGPCP
jgi:hypothetical protein